jgi:hypothetical protein
VPSGGWHVVYADAFGAQPSTDTTFSWQNGSTCCGTGFATLEAANVRVGLSGLELFCTGPEATAPTWRCSGGNTDRFVELDYAGAGTWAAECVAKIPANTGAADPSCWTYATNEEIDFFELWGWGGTSWANVHGGMPVVTTPYVDHCLCNVESALGFDPSLAFHRYTTEVTPLGGESFRLTEFIDGAERWSFVATMPHATDGLILTNNLREPKGGGYASADVMSVRSVALYQDGAHAGQGVRGGGVAPGTTLK